MLKVGCEHRELERVALEVGRGATVVYPTDTVYGFGCDPFNREAVARILRVKGREGRPLPVLCFDIDEVAKLVHIPLEGKGLVERYWPGPLTIVAMLKASGLPCEVTLGTGSLGVRVPNHPYALKLIRLAGGRLIGTSANRTGLKAPRSADEVLRVLGDDFDFLVDGGPTPLGIESTVLDLRGGESKVIREGYLKADALVEYMKRKEGS